MEWRDLFEGNVKKVEGLEGGRRDLGWMDQVLRIIPLFHSHGQMNFMIYGVATPG